jgi:hypothetical protein
VVVVPQVRQDQMVLVVVAEELAQIIFHILMHQLPAVV